jgi:hypothetical protein
VFPPPESLEFPGLSFLSHFLQERVGIMKKTFAFQYVIIVLYIPLNPSDITHVILAVLPDLPDQSV